MNLNLLIHHVLISLVFRCAISESFHRKWWIKRKVNRYIQEEKLETKWLWETLNAIEKRMMWNRVQKRNDPSTSPLMGQWAFEKMARESNEIHQISSIGNTFRMDRKKVSPECCPSIKRWTSPIGAISQHGRIVELYRDKSNKTIQHFMQDSCRPDFLNKPCQFIDKRFVSRCEQQYSWVYAIIRDYYYKDPWKIGLIKVKAGCSCIMQPRKKPMIPPAHRMPQLPASVEIPYT